jgi:hypothetical protein
VRLPAVLLHEENQRQKIIGPVPASLINSGWLLSSPVIIEIPVRADKRHGNLKEGAVPNHE